MSQELIALKEYVWKRVGVRRLLVGRKRIDELTEAAIANWDSQAIENVSSDRELDIVCEGMVIGVKRTHQMLGDHDFEEYGFLWAILLQALASAVVQILVRWWLESRANRAFLETARREVTG
jgi:hypothetical protein